MIRFRFAGAFAAAGALMASSAAWGQTEDDEAPPQKRTRVALGPQLVPSYPGADGVSLRPLIDYSRADEGEPFTFEAADESFGFALLRSGGFSAGPSLGIEGKREATEVGTLLPEVDFSLEIGGFVQQEFSDTMRVRAEVRQGVTGHEGLISILSADYVMRKGLTQEIAFGPRVTIADDSYQDAYFSVRPEDASAAGLPAFDAGGGIQAVGATLGYIRQFSPRWGIYAYAKYDRLVGDAADSPIVREYGSRDQISGGVALTYSFGAI